MRAAEHAGQGEEKGEDRPDPEKAFKNLSSLTEDDLTWLKPEEIARGLAPGLEVIAHKGQLKVAMADGDLRAVGRARLSPMATRGLRSYLNSRRVRRRNGVVRLSGPN